MVMKSFYLYFSWMIFVFLFVGCGDDETVTERFSMTPIELNGFGHERITVEDSQCAIPEEVTVKIQEIEGVLVAISEDGCQIAFDVQGGDGGPAPIVLVDDGEELAVIDGLSYTAPLGDGLFESVWCIGDSLGAAMVSWYLSYESQVKDGMFAFFFRQISAFGPHPLVRSEGVPALFTLKDVSKTTGEIPQDTIATPEILGYILGLDPISNLRANHSTVARNQSVPGMHDVTWPLNPTVYDLSSSVVGDLDSTVVLGLYERLLRFPDGVPDNPTSIMDTVEAGNPTFIAVSPGVAAYALDRVYISDRQLAVDLDLFLSRLADMPSEPAVMLATMPDTASLPARPFSYAERYFNTRVNNQLYTAAERANSKLEEPRFIVVPMGEMYISWFSDDPELQIGGTVYNKEVDSNGWQKIILKMPSGEREPMGLGRFQGFFSLDHVHLTPTGHALAANMMLDSVNREWGPDGVRPKFLNDLPEVDIPAVLNRDNQTETRLNIEASELGFPELSSLLDPIPPSFSHSEYCSLSGGPLELGSSEGCPLTIEITVNSEPCNGPISFPAQIEVIVRDELGQPVQAAVGLSAIPPEEHLLMTYLSGGMTDSEGVLSVTVESDGLEADVAGGSLVAESGGLSVLCELPQEW